MLATLTIVLGLVLLVCPHPLVAQESFAPSPMYGAAAAYDAPSAEDLPCRPLSLLKLDAPDVCSELHLDPGGGDTRDPSESEPSSGHVAAVQAKKYQPHQPFHFTSEGPVLLRRSETGGDYSNEIYTADL
jgi:hypothetical protein